MIKDINTRFLEQNAQYSPNSPSVKIWSTVSDVTFPLCIVPLVENNSTNIYFFRKGIPVYKAKYIIFQEGNTYRSILLSIILDQRHFRIY